MELFRVAVGLPIAATFPHGIPTLNTRKAATIALSVAYGVVVLLPLLSSWRGWTLLVFTGLVSFAIGKGMRLNRIAKEEGGKTPWGHFLVGKLASVLFVVVSAAGVAAMLVPNFPVLESVGMLLKNDRAIIISNGYIGSMFAGDLLVSHAVGPLLDRLPRGESNDAAALSNAGAHIGWIERALFFPLFAGGAAAAAAIAFTAKSLVRLPGLHDNSHKNMAEYVLVGSMLSALVALLFAIITRLALGMSPI